MAPRKLPACGGSIDQLAHIALRFFHRDGPIGRREEGLFIETVTSVAQKGALNNDVSLTEVNGSHFPANVWGDYADRWLELAEAGLEVRWLRRVVKSPVRRFRRSPHLMRQG